MKKSEETDLNFASLCFASKQKLLNRSEAKNLKRKKVKKTNFASLCFTSKRTWDTWGGVSRSPRRSVVDTCGLLCGPPRRYCPIFLLFLWLSTCHFAKDVSSRFSIAVPNTCCFTYILVVFSNAL
jgi:hypothetical protein